MNISKAQLEGGDQDKVLSEDRFWLIPPRSSLARFQHHAGLAGVCWTLAVHQRTRGRAGVRTRPQTQMETSSCETEAANGEYSKRNN